VNDIKEVTATEETAPSQPAVSTEPASAPPAVPEPEASTAQLESEPDPLEVSRAELARVRDQLLRTAADFDNFRKRSRREVEDASKKARDDLLRDMLPVFDNLERAVAHAKVATDVNAMADGIDLVMCQFIDTLGKLGIERIEAKGQPFDPTVHEAIQNLPTADHPPGTVADQVQTGYRMGERLIRPALVVVAKEP